MNSTYAINLYPLSRTESMVYELLYNLFADSKSKGKDYTYCSRKYIAQEVHVCLRTAQRAVHALRDKGLITIKRMGLCENDRITIVNFGKDALPQKIKHGKNVASGSDMVSPIHNSYNTNNSANTILSTDTVVNNHIMSNRDDETKMTNYDGATAKQTTASEKAARNTSKPRNAKERAMVVEKLKRDWNYQQEFGDILKFTRGTPQANTYIKIMRAVEEIIFSIADSHVSVRVHGQKVEDIQFLQAISNLKVWDVHAIVQRIQRGRKGMDEFGEDTGKYPLRITNPKQYLFAALYNESWQKRVGLLE